MNTNDLDVTRHLVDLITAVADGRIELSKLVAVVDNWQTDLSYRGKNAWVASHDVTPTTQSTLRARGGYLAVLSLAVRLEALTRDIQDADAVLAN